jgi:8-oxo-dGTP pyrophosphatase MutT (NUDIX family)
MTPVCCVIPEWDSLLVLHRKDAEAEWELPCAEAKEGEDVKEAAKAAAKEKLGIDVEVAEKLGEKEGTAFFLAKIKSGIPKATSREYDRVRYMEFFILAKKAEKLSQPLAMLIEEMRAGRIKLQKKASISWGR